MLNKNIMKKKVVRLTESDLVRLVKKVIREGEAYAHHDETGWVVQDDESVPYDYMDNEGSMFDEQRTFGPGEYDDFMEFINNCNNNWCLKTKMYYDKYAEKGPIRVRKM